MKGEPVYLDYAASTPPDPAVVAAMRDCVDAGVASANPSSTHAMGRRAVAAIESAREKVATLLHTTPDNVIWTSGATESDNLAIQGIARGRAHRGRHLITMPTEHKAVTDPFRALEKDGFEVTWLEPGSNGRLETAALVEAIREDTQLVSVMHVNNETGVIQDIADLASACRERGVLFHCDAAQSTGKLDVDLASWPVDLLSLTGHKFYGPQGIGALYVADTARRSLMPIMYGGGQEKRLRPGTLPVHLIVGLGAAADVAVARRADDLAHARSLRARLVEGLEGIAGLTWNSPEDAYPGIVNVSAAGVEGESLMLALEPVCVASGSACNSAVSEPSYVLRAMGLNDIEAQAAVRFSFGRMSETADIDAGVARYRAALDHLRGIAPAA
jgi:cysteine desulfurase